MHRSGTSLVSGMLEVLGVNFGRDLLPPMLGVNDKGFWEDREVLQAHEDLLSSLGRSWYDLISLPDNWMNSNAAIRFRKVVQELIEVKFEHISLLGLKDPRMCLFLPLWKEMLDKMHISYVAVVVERNPLEIALSLFRRDGLPPLYGLALNNFYFSHMQQALQGIPVAKLNFSNLLKNWNDELSSVLNVVGIEAFEEGNTAKIEQLMDRSLKHYAYEEGLISELANFLCNPSVTVTGELLDYFIRVKNIWQQKHGEFIDMQKLTAKMESLEREHSHAQHVKSEQDSQVESLTSNYDKPRCRVLSSEHVRDSGIASKVDIVIPVYDGFEETVQCLDSVLSSDLAGAHVIVINDCSPNVKLSQWLEDQANAGQFKLIENKVNLGFVATVNKGMALHPERDVILLNSDTIVANDWVCRLLVHGRQERIGTVTPFSNNATICSFPNFCEENELLGPVGEMDSAFKIAHPGKSVEIPTAIGFCMYISRECLNQVGLFDEQTFGQGYGEENDFCMSASRKGWRHLIAADIFVAHIGGVSFSDKKAAMVKAAQQTLDRRYPDYHEKVHRFINKDPLRKLRLKAHAAYIHHSTRKTILLISHRLGGGVEKHVQELESHLGGEGFFPILRLGENPGEYELGLATKLKDKILLSLPDDYEQLLDLCRFLGVGRIYFHHMMGFDPIMSNLAKDLECEMDFMIHDYYLINANPTLTDSNGRFCFDPVIRDSECQKRYPIPFGMEPSQWRKEQSNFLSKCQRVIAPCRYTAELFNNYFSDISVAAVYHPDSLDVSYPEPRQPKKNADGLVKVLVLGAISREKGADVLEAVAQLAAKKAPHLSFHLLGYAYRPLNGVVEHGPYSEEEVDAAIVRIAADMIWYPALWPETYSYTLSEGLRSGLPILATNLGAFPERLEGRPLSCNERWDLSPDKWLVSILDSLETKGKDSSGQNDAWRHIYADSTMFYERFWDSVLKVDRIPMDLETLISRSSVNGLAVRESLLMLLVVWRNKPAFRWISRLIPFSIQQRIKRWFSDKPIHDLMRYWGKGL